MRETKARTYSVLATVLVLVAGALIAGPGVALAQFEVASFSSQLSNSQAGAHADFSSSFALGTEALGNPDGQLRDAKIALPPGLIGDPQTIERCSVETLVKLDCKGTSQVGEMSLTVVECRGVGAALTAAAEAGATTITVPDAKAFCTEENGDTITVGTGGNAETARVSSIVNATTIELLTPLEHSHAAGESVTHIANTQTASLPLFNIQPSGGHVATFAASLLLADVLIQVNVGEGGGLTATISEASTLLPIQASTVTLWGVPAAASHNVQRCNELNYECGPSKAEPAPFMTNPTSCSGPLSVGLSLTSWQGQSASGSGTLPPLTGCENLTMSPSLAVAPTSTRRDSPAGYEVDLQQPQDEGPYGLATPDLEKVAITLPQGTSLSPGLANGLQACEQAQFTEADCPGASTVGSAEVSSPLLAEPLKGAVYVGAPTATEKYPLLVRVKVGDTTIALHGQALTNETTGQVTAVFEGAPQIPFSSLKVNFFGGPGAALANPATCGPATSTASITSYAGQVSSPSSTFAINEDSEGGACPAASPFAPSFAGGTIDALAGQYSPFSMTISRPDGQQDLSSFSAQFPPGLVGLAKNVPLCREPEAASGSCAASSIVGTATIAAGAGALPFDVSGPIYLTSSYDGSPYGLDIVVKAIAGPFNLGTVLVRARILLNPNTLIVTIASDPFPQILSGMPLRVRSVNVTLDRPEFVINPTSCTAKTITTTIDSSEGASANVLTPFGVADCGQLAFAPHMKVSTQAKASKAGNGASLDIDVTKAPSARATMRSVVTQLPPELEARLTTIQDACLTNKEFASVTACPPASIVGQATVDSLADVQPLSGPIYLVVHAINELPSLVVILRSEQIKVELEATLSMSAKGVISTSFKNLPDVPISALNLSFPRGPHSLLGAVASLCAQPMGLQYKVADQSGAGIKGSLPIAVSGCPRHKSKATKATKAKRAKSRSRA